MWCMMPVDVEEGILCVVHDASGRRGGYLVCGA